MSSVDFSKFLSGRGLDTSLRRCLKTKNVKYIKKEYNNLYFLYPEVKFESQDFVYNKNSVNRTKFPIILLTEWMKYVKVGGYLVLTFKSNKHLRRGSLLKIYSKFLSRYSKIVAESKDSGEWTFVFQKTKTLMIKGDSIDKWTFGIPTIGKRKDWLREFIKSIRDQKIPHYEILIVGTWNDPEVMGPDIKYIHYTKRDHLNWITRKKNIICEKARYENVLILHDRFKLDKNWFAGMKKFGNCWDALFFPIIDKTGFEFVHWGIWGRWFERIGYLDIRDWREDYFVGGAFMAMKKTITKKVKHNENRYWSEQEDAEHGLRITKAGYVIRANPYAKTHTFITLIKDAPFYDYHPQKLGKATEYRGKKWIIPQIIIDVTTRVVGLPYLRVRRKISLLVRRFIHIKGYNIVAGGKRD